MTDTIIVDGSITPKDTGVGLLTQWVFYVASDGKRKIALVTGTPEFITEASGAVHALEGDQLHLEIHSPSGKIYARQTVNKKTAEGQTNVWEPLTK